MGPPRTVHVLRWTGISGWGARESEENRDIPSKYEMRWGVNEVETQRGDSRWQERRLRPEVRGGGAGQWPGQGLGGLRWGPRSRLQVLQDEGPSPGSQDITCCCLGPPLLCFPPREKPLQLWGVNTLQTLAPRHWCLASLEPCIRPPREELHSSENGDLDPVFLQHCVHSWAQGLAAV